jgi:cytochrome c oxidase assembly protein subunit 15
MNPALHRLAVTAAIVAFAVIVLGAYVRLSHAGLGCPDWPGCYGQLTWPDETHELARANEAFPDRPVEPHKAWKEMVHRYLAGALVLLVLALNFLAWKAEYRQAGVRVFAGALLGLILFQAALGMWTVTLKLLPIVVMAHLLGGLATFGMLLWLSWRSSGRSTAASARMLAPLRGVILTGMAVLILQVALGGWTSANYAALACPDLPTCQGQWWPEADFADAFTIWREIGADYEGGVLDQPARAAIHLAHRIGAVLTFLVLAFLGARLLRVQPAMRAGVVLLVLLLAQVTLGVLNVALFLPLPNAVAHNGVAALLLAQMLWLTYRSRARRPTWYG